MKKPKSLDRAVDSKRDAVSSAAELYYIQNTGFCGNCMKWWCVDGGGYTLNLDDAWMVSAEEAKRICRSRPGEDIAWPVASIDALACRHLNVEALRSLTALSDQHPPKAAGVDQAPCGECGGTGKIVNDGPYSDCDDCNGTGVDQPKGGRVS